MIKHLVISGGGPTLFRSIGVIQYLQENNYLSINDLKSIYGTSAGGIIAVILCLRFDWETINNYIIERPWHDAYPVDIKSILDAYTKRGIFDKKFLEIFFKPLFDAKDISLDITLAEFYEYSKIEIHLYSFEINHFQMEDISYKTHPAVSLLVALQMTCAIPIIMSPVCINNRCYVDGGVICNYPLKYCLDCSGNNAEEILGIKNEYQSISEKYNVSDDSSIIDFIICFLYKLIFHLSEPIQEQLTCSEITCKSEFMTLAYLKSVLSSKDTRRAILEEGIEIAKEFLQKKQEKEDLSVKY